MLPNKELLSSYESDTDESENNSYFIYQMRKDLKEGKFASVKAQVLPYINQLKRKIYLISELSSDSENCYEIEYLYTAYDLMKNACQGLGDDENYKIYKKLGEELVTLFEQEAKKVFQNDKLLDQKLEKTKSEDSSQSSPACEPKQIVEENISSIFKKLYDLTEMKNYSDAIKVLEKFKPLIDFDNNEQIFYKMLYLYFKNKCFYELKSISENKYEITENFAKMEKIIKDHARILINKLGTSEYINMIDRMYCDHLKIFFDFSKNGYNSTSTEINYFKSFIACGIKGIRINKNDLSNRKSFAIFLNKYVSEKYNIHALPVTTKISDETLIAWEQQINEQLAALTLTPDYLYSNSMQIVNEYGYHSLDAKKALEEALKNTSLLINKITANILLARCYSEQHIAGAVRKYQAAINQIKILKEDAKEIPDIWSLHLECGLALLKENNNIDGAVKEFNKALKEFNKALKFKLYFSQNKVFFKVNSVTILQLIAEYLMEYTAKTPTPDYAGSLEAFFNVLIELNVKQADQSVYACLAEAYANLGQLKKSADYLERVSDVELRPRIFRKQEKIKMAVLLDEKINKKEKVSPKLEKKPGEEVLLSKEPVLVKTAEQIKAEEKEEAAREKRNEIRAAKRLEDRQREKEKKQQQLELTRIERENFEKEKERERIEAYQKRKLENAKKKLKKSKHKSKDPSKKMINKQKTKKEGLPPEDALTREQRKQAMLFAKVQAEVAAAQAKKKSEQEKKKSDREIERAIRKMYEPVHVENKSIINEVKLFEVREAQEKAKQAELTRIEQAAKKNRVTEKTPKNIIHHVDEKLIHSGIIEVALALHYKDKDVHAIIEKDPILSQLKLLNKAIAPLKICFKGTSIVEGSFTAKKGMHVNFDCNDIDIFIENVPSFHVPKKNKPLTVAEKKENELYEQLQAALKKHQFIPVPSKKHRFHFSNYTFVENSRVQLAVTHVTYKSKDLFYFSSYVKAYFSDKNGLDFINENKEDRSIEDLILECDLINATMENVTNFFARLLKYYEKGQINGLKFGINFMKALDQEWQYNFFLTKFFIENSLEGSSQYCEMISVIKGNCLDDKKVLPTTFAAAKNLLTAFSKAAYYKKFHNQTTNQKLHAFISDILIKYYAQYQDKVDCLYQDLDFLLYNAAKLTSFSVDSWILALIKHHELLVLSRTHSMGIFSQPVFPIPTGLTTPSPQNTLLMVRTNLFSPTTTESLTPTPTLTPLSKSPSYRLTPTEEGGSF